MQTKTTDKFYQIVFEVATLKLLKWSAPIYQRSALFISFSPHSFGLIRRVNKTKFNLCHKLWPVMCAFVVFLILTFWLVTDESSEAYRQTCTSLASSVNQKFYILPSDLKQLFWKHMTCILWHPHFNASETMLDRWQTLWFKCLPIHDTFADLIGSL